MMFVSLVLTYLSQVYNALLRRNALALKIRALSEEKGDGAELVCRLWPRGDLDSGASALADLAGEMAAVKETHHFYPLLMQFRFEQPFLLRLAHGERVARRHVPRHEFAR